MDQANISRSDSAEKFNPPAEADPKPACRAPFLSWERRVHITFPSSISPEQARLLEWDFHVEQFGANWNEEV